MTPSEFLWEPRPVVLRAVQRFSPVASLLTVNKRLASAERELAIQFTRIAQLQAQVDLLRAASRRSPDGAEER
jgi:hypothetical protein